jgi:hypothetical protein
MRAPAFAIKKSVVEDVGLRSGLSRSMAGSLLRIVEGGELINLVDEEAEEKVTVLQVSQSSCSQPDRLPGSVVGGRSSGWLAVGSREQSPTSKGYCKVSGFDHSRDPKIKSR